MNLNIRRTLVEKLLQREVYSMDPPEIQVNGRIEFDFYLVLVSMCETLHSWTGEKVFRTGRNGQKGEWHIWTENKKYLLALKRKGRRLHILGVKFQGNVFTYLKSVEDRIDIDYELQGYTQDVERSTTNRMDFPTEVVEQWIAEHGYARGKHLQIGTDSRLTPPPLPLRPQCTPNDD